MVRLANLNDICGCLMTILKIHTICTSIKFIDIKDILCTVLIRIEANERANSIVASCMILTNEILEFLVICMNFDIVLRITTKLYITILFKYWHILYVSTIIIRVNENSIDYLSFIATKTTIMWKIIKTIMIQFGDRDLLSANGDVVYLIIVI